MGISIDRGKARARLGEALDWALSDRPVPTDWADTTRAVGAAPQRTYIPALGTALLARATTSRVDALSIKESYADNTYSLRTLGHSVLVPASRDTFDLAATGREPLNNQPFFRYDHMQQIDRVQPSARPVLSLLRKRLADLNRLTEDEALAGLAAFLRERIAVFEARVRPALPAVAAQLQSALSATHDLLRLGPDVPRATQALVAAVFDLSHADVRSRRINDPSRDLPGDVQVYAGGLPVGSVEVRAKPVTQGEADAFIDAVADAGMTRAIIVPIHVDHLPLNRHALFIRGAIRGVVTNVYESVEELMAGALGWGDRLLKDRLDEFPQAVAGRLHEIEAPNQSQALWARLFAAHPSDR